MARRGGFRLDVRELEELASDLAASANMIGPLAVGVQQKYGALIVKEAIRRAPRRTGALKRSIRISPRGEAGSLGLTGVAIEADTTTETGRSYAGFVEFGTSRMKAQPFMRPALRKYAKAYRADLVDAAAALIGTKKAARAGIKNQSVFRGGSSFNLGKALQRNK